MLTLKTSLGELKLVCFLFKIVFLFLLDGREGITAFFTDGQVNWEGKARSMQIDFVCNATAGKVSDTNFRFF